MNTRLFKRPALPLLATAALVAAACGDDDPMAPTTGPVAADVSTLDFGDLDTEFGAGAEHTFTITNTSSSSVSVGPLTLEGDAAQDFYFASDPGIVTLAPGASREVSLSFDPGAEGDRGAQVVIAADGREGAVVFVSGRGRAFQYRQVDRMGIPALNTVFNHPPQFSKTDYNVATPAQDVMDYTGLFETVLGAVGNGDPSSTAALLLPDALPVSLSGPTVFAMLTGRDLADDAVDVALSVTVGDASLHSDFVDTNDKAFLTDFPYLAEAHR